MVEIISYHFTELKIFRPSTGRRFLHDSHTSAGSTDIHG